MHDWWAFKSLELQDVCWTVKLHKLVTSNRIVDAVLPSQYSIEAMPNAEKQFWQPSCTAANKKDKLDMEPLEDEVGDDDDEAT